VFEGFGTGVDGPLSGEIADADPHALPRRLRVGVAMRYPSPVSLRRPVLTVAAANEKILQTDGLVYRGGIEVVPVDFLALRLGYAVGNALHAPACGVGAMIGMVRLDYAFAKEGVPTGVHHAAISIAL
jgi:hypothetical protein